MNRISGNLPSAASKKKSPQVERALFKRNYAKAKRLDQWLLISISVHAFGMSICPIHFEQLTDCPL